MMNARLFCSLLLLVCGSSTFAAHTVQKGETLYSISRMYGLNVQQLKKLNKLESNVIEIGQQLRTSSKEPLPPAPKTPTPTKRTQTPAAPTIPPELTEAEKAKRAEEQIKDLKPTLGKKLTGVHITVPNKIKMGDAFVMSLSGPKAGEAIVNFPSELSEDVRKPNEILVPMGAAGEYRVLGRAVLGKTNPLIYEVRVDEDMVRGTIAVENLRQTVQHLNLPAKTTRVLRDPTRKKEEQLVEQAYALRTPQYWSRPFAPPLTKHAAQSSRFGQARTYRAGGDLKYHYGTDYPAPTGTPVQAVNDGKVVVAGKYPVRGGLVILDHGAGLTSLYFHLSSVAVKTGQHIKRGHVIGKVGNTGLSKGAHLHLEFRVRGEAVDPLLWFNRLWPQRYQK